MKLFKTFQNVMAVSFVFVYFFVLEMHDPLRLAIGVLTSIFLLCVFYFVREDSGREAFWLEVLFVLFALFSVVGESYLKMNSWDLFAREGNRILAVCTLWGLTLVNRALYRMLKRAVKCLKLFQRYEFHSTVGKYLFYENRFLRYFVLILLLGIPWMVAYAPGTLAPDAYRQIMEGTGKMGISTHHPVSTTLLIGTCINIGRKFFQSDSIGLFFYVFSQFIAQTICFAYVNVTLGRLRAPVALRVGTILFQTLLPLFPIWGITCGKDVGYYLSFTLFIAAFMNLQVTNGGGKWALIVGAIGCVQFRNDGRYIVIPILLTAMCLLKGYRKLFAATTLAAVLSIILINSTYSYLHVTRGAVREVLSIPMQQTARYVREYPDDITAEEAVVLGQIFGGEMGDGYDKIAELYDENISDPVKDHFCAYPTEEQLKAYFKVWFQQLLRHPDVYIQAFLNHVYGYFYPGKPFVYPTGNGYGYLEGIAWFKMLQGDECIDANVNVSFWIKNSMMRKSLEECVKFFSRCPFIRFLYHPGTYFWVLFGVTALMLAKKKAEKCVCLIPPFLVLLMCMLSPVNANIRYALPVMATIPLFLAWCNRCLTEETR